MEANLNVIFFIFVQIAELLQRVEADVVIGQDEPIGRDERSRAAAIEADGRFLNLLKPILCRLEVIFGFQLGIKANY